LAQIARKLVLSIANMVIAITSTAIVLMDASQVMRMEEEISVKEVSISNL
jgi:hypothetical protein